MTQAGVGPSSWTDAYLAAFAENHSYSLVTFDTGFERWSAQSDASLDGVEPGQLAEADAANRDRKRDGKPT